MKINGIGKKTPQVTIVMYHYVRNLARSRYPKIKARTISDFNAQLKYIRKQYTVLRMEDILGHINAKEKLPPNALILTFDDGYKDHFDTVFPILDSLGMQGSFFPSAKAIKEDKVLDVNKIHFVIAAAENENELIKCIFQLLDKYRTKYGLKSNEFYYKTMSGKDRYDSEKIVFIKTLLQKGLPEKLRNTIVADLFKKYITSDESAFSQELYMSIDHLKCMRRHGMYIGSHGWEHYWLDTLQADKQEAEVKRSRQFLHDIGCDLSSWVMCYPNGAHNNSLISILKAQGCRLGLSTKVGVADFSSDDHFALPRLDTNDLPC